MNGTPFSDLGRGKDIDRPANRYLANFDKIGCP